MGKFSLPTSSVGNTTSFGKLHKSIFHDFYCYKINDLQITKIATPLSYSVVSHHLMRIRPSFIVYGSAAALFASLAVVLLINFQPNPGQGEPPLGPGFASLCWLAVFFLPPLAVAYRAKEQGAIYGMAIGLVPLGIAFLVGYSVPLFIAFIFYAAAPLGGVLGQRLARIKSTVSHVKR